MHTNKKIRYRETFYLSGYDPRGVNYYYNLYKKEAKKQSTYENIEIQVGKKERSDEYVYSWQVLYKKYDDLNGTKTNYHFLSWDDLVRKEWRKSFFQLFKDLIYYVRIYLLGGHFLKYIKLVPRQVISIFLPLLYSIFVAVIILATMTTLPSIDIMGIPHIVIYTCMVVLMGIFAYYAFKWAEKNALFWLVRIFTFSLEYVSGEKDELMERLNIFSNFIRTRIKETPHVDEILIVSHSVGTILTIPLVEMLMKKIENERDSLSLPSISILTLGECIPLVSGLPDATDYRQRMSYLAKQDSIVWRDYSSVIDGACFPQLNFFENSNISLQNPDCFSFLSPRFHLLYSQSSYVKLRKDKYMSHFLYLMATEKKGGYNFFTLTSGTKPLQCNQ